MCTHTLSHHTHNNISGYVTHRHDFPPFLSLTSCAQGLNPPYLQHTDFPTSIVSLARHFQNQHSIAGLKSPGDLLPSSECTDWELKALSMWLQSTFSILTFHFHYIILLLHVYGFICLLHKSFWTGRDTSYLSLLFMHILILSSQRMSV